MGTVQPAVASKFGGIILFQDELEVQWESCGGDTVRCIWYVPAIYFIFVTSPSKPKPRNSGELEFSSRKNHQKSAIFLTDQSSPLFDLSCVSLVSIWSPYYTHTIAGRQMYQVPSLGGKIQPQDPIRVLGVDTFYLLILSLDRCIVVLHGLRLL